MVQYQQIEEDLVTEVYINCFGSEDAFFANHLSNLLQMYECETECNNIKCPIKKKVYRNSYLSFNVVDGTIQHPIIAQYKTQLTEKCGNEITKWSPSTVVPLNAELRHLKKIKILDTTEGYEDESSGTTVLGDHLVISLPHFSVNCV
ncbi:unnamed protein product, partial [Rotaria sp. Silwood2]